MKKFVPVLIAGALLSTTAAFALFGTIRFGYDGRSGYGGAAGVSGGSGQSIVVRADGAAKSFDLSGVDGISGAPGSDGESARGCGAYYDTDNLIGADGGHGGSGGSGGTGGTGGNLTVYANTINDLSQILVRSSGGRPGFGAPGGRGGMGCQCAYSVWQKTICTKPTPPATQPQCSNYTFTCSSGRHGQYGRNGTNGSPGSQGSLTVIEKSEPLSPENKFVQTTLGGLNQSPVTLVEHLWTFNQGAANYLAPGSVIADTFRRYTSTFTAQVGLSWQASQSLENFKASGVSVSTDQSQVRVDVASSAWLNSEVSVQENSRTLLVHDAYLESEVAQFEVGKLTGVGKDLKLEIIEKNHLPLPLQAKFKLKYMSKGHFSYWNINWNEEVPAEWIMRDGGSYWIDLGKLPIDDSLRKKGWIIGVELQATHFLGEHSKTVQIDKYGHRIGTDE